jgi:DinB superfamily
VGNGAPPDKTVKTSGQNCPAYRGDCNMNGTQAVIAALKSTEGMPAWYLSDLSDADLTVRPNPTSHHIAWQMGHLIDAEAHIVKMILPDAKYPELPKGFSEKHSKEAGKNDSGFLTKAEYLNLFAKAREATIAAVSKLTDADLDKPTSGNMAKFAPTWGAMLLLTSNHVLMHVGQFTPVRRKLGKPVLF